MTCIICAMDIEYEKIKKYFLIIKETVINDNISISECNNMIIAKSGIGKSSAAICTKYIIEKYMNISYFVSAGIAGAISPNIKIGDIVIGQTVFDYIHSDIINEYSFTQSSIINSQFFDDNINIHIGKTICSDVLINNKEVQQDLYKKCKALCVDMESAGIAEICKKDNIKFTSTKIISDLADQRAILSMIRTQNKITEKLGYFLSLYIKKITKIIN